MNDTNTSVLKTQAKALRAFLREQGVAFSHSQTLEAVARIHGFKDWNTASVRTESKPDPTADYLSIPSEVEGWFKERSDLRIVTLTYTHNEHGTTRSGSFEYRRGT